MSSEEEGRRVNGAARLRFSIIGPLLAAPPRERGELGRQLRELASKTWKDPVSGLPRRFSVSTLERWFYKARPDDVNPIEVLGRRVRRDAGRFKSLSTLLRVAVQTQYDAHRHWSARLHYDNLVVLAQKHPELGSMPSYSTLRRYMRSRGFTQRPRRRLPETQGAERALLRLEEREVRSYEAEYAHALWHADFHEGSRCVLSPQGDWVPVYLLGVLDDHSRLACHLQWYLSQTVEAFVHGLSQAFQKRGLPRGLMTDNGSAMRAAETERGLERLGIPHEKTLPYSPYQNAKQESFWGQVEGRLMAMLEDERELTLEGLNLATQAWVELEYNRKVHSELGMAPLTRLLSAPSVVRECGSAAWLKHAFRQEVTRQQRKSDGTVSVAGVRYEVPSAYRHLERLFLAYASWDLSTVDLLERLTGRFLLSLYPLDKAANAARPRRPLEPLAGQQPETHLPAGEPLHTGSMAPLLEKLLEQYQSSGLPPAYLPLRENPAPQREAVSEGNKLECEDEDEEARR